MIAYRAKLKRENKKKKEEDRTDETTAYLDEDEYNKSLKQNVTFKEVCQAFNEVLVTRHDKNSDKITHLTML